MPLKKCSFGVDVDGDPWDDYPRMMTNAEINELPMAKCKVPIELIGSIEDAEEAVEEILSSGDRLLGFDTETRPSFTKGEPPRPPAVVQFASKRKVWLFHLFEMANGGDNGYFWDDYEDAMDVLEPIMCNERILKVGSGVADDVRRKLCQYFNGLGGFRDICRIAKALDFPRPGLRNVAACLLGLDVVKHGARISNWEHYPLSGDQEEYAAVDAVISRMVYCRLETLRRLYEEEEDGDCDYD